MMRVAILCAVAAILLAGWLSPASAHRPSDAYLSLEVSDDRVDGRWDIALRDLDHAIGLDLDQDGMITWGELKSRHDAISAFALARLEIGVGAEACPTETVDHLFERHDDNGYAVLRFTAECPAPIADLQIAYDLLFDLDPLHRGLVQVSFDGQTHSATFSPDRRRWDISATTPRYAQQVWNYVIEGAWHIWIGFDHILFLILLLLPAALRWEAGAWRPLSGLGEISKEVIKVVTAFTLAHSITLCLATLGWLSVPGRVAEPLIAATIVVAALNNLWPVVTRGLWAVAFGFGLIHGIGFAGALGALGLPTGSLLLSLAGFNIGVELGQVAIVAGFLPLAFWLRRSPLYPRIALRLGSTVIAGVATLWLIERAFGIALIT